MAPSRAFLLLLASSSLLLCLVSAVEPIFYDSFEESWEGRWIPSTKEEYQGVWKHEKSEGHENSGLLISEKARKYGIAADLPEIVEFKDEPVVLQYDLRLQNGLECGGAYLKFLLPQEAGWTPSKLDNESPYSIMFGPDKCGATNKVHFIFRHKNPKTGKYVEHHLKSPPAPITDKLSHVYTAILYPNNSVSILVDGEVKKTADLLSADFEPPVLPRETIPDPEDKKPEDWDERAKIPDPEATKPEDWDEDAPFEIEDLEAEKPEGWLDDEPEEVDDEEAVKPEDWDDDEDGEWEAPKIPNPKCIDAPGCGEWKRPTKKNPAYKGKWYAPMIDNPNYKGIWKPRDIPNPDYFHLEKPNMEAIAAIAIEIWTMQDGILFDNVLVTRNVDLAKEYRDKEWKAKYDAEKEKKKEEEAAEAVKSGFLAKVQEVVFKFLYQITELSFLGAYKDQLTDLIKKGEEKPILTLSILGALVLVILTVIFKLLFGGKKKAPKKVPLEVAKKEDISSADDATTEKVEEKESDEAPAGEDGSEAEGVSGARHRSVRRET